jgi:hypothetical protein
MNKKEYTNKNSLYSPLYALAAKLLQPILKSKRFCAYCQLRQRIQPIPFLRSPVQATADSFNRLYITPLRAKQLNKKFI